MTASRTVVGALAIGVALTGCGRAGDRASVQSVAEGFYAAGDTVFLQDTRQGRRIAAAGCRPHGHGEPAQCEVAA